MTRQTALALGIALLALVLTCAAGIGAWILVLVSLKREIPEHSRLIALSPHRALAVGDDPEGAYFVGVRDGRVSWRWDLPRESVPFLECAAADPYVACDSYVHATEVYSAHLFDVRRGHVATVSGRYVSGFDVDEEGAMAVHMLDSTEFGAPGSMRYRAPNGETWTRAIDAIGSSKTASVLTAHYAINELAAFDRAGATRVAPQNLPWVGVSRAREEILLEYDGALVVRELGSERERAGPPIANACLLGRRGGAWILATERVDDDIAPAIVSIDARTLTQRWRTELPGEDWVDCRHAPVGFFARTLLPFDHALGPEAIVLASELDLVGVEGSSSHGTLYSIDLERGAISWSAPLAITESRTYFARFDSIAYLVLTSGSSDEPSRVMRFRGGELERAIELPVPVESAQLIGQGMWVHGDHAPVFLRSLHPSNEASEVRDITAETRRELDSRP